MTRNINKLIEDMTLEEKGKSLLRIKFGLRKQAEGNDHLGIYGSVKSTCFPSAAGVASSWDRALIERMVAALGQECQSEDVSILLGPGANIKRFPLCGRNFEYFSEDPLLSSEMSTSHINGVQNQGVGTSDQ